MYRGSWVEEDSSTRRTQRHKNSRTQAIILKTLFTDVHARTFAMFSILYSNVIYIQQQICQHFFSLKTCDPIVLWLQHCWMNFVYIVYFTNVLLFLFVDTLANVIEWFFFSLIFSFFNLKWSIRGKTNKGSDSFDDMKRLKLQIMYKTRGWFRIVLHSPRQIVKFRVVLPPPRQI